MQIRIDERMARDGLAPSRSVAQRLLMAGSVRVDGQLVDKASVKVNDEQHVEVLASPRFVSRGGDKLANALKDHAAQIADRGWSIEGSLALDVGASTGGFTDCLLQEGAARVIAVDVGYGQLHASLRTDSRVTNLERTNARHLSMEDLPFTPNLLVCDASFIALRTVLASAVSLMDPQWWWGILLIKPQFEAGRERMSRYGRKGVLTDALVRETVRDEAVASLVALGMNVVNVVEANPRGPKGNIEYAALVCCP